MTSTDVETLADMGFEKARAEMAVKKAGGLQGALEWLEKYQDKPMDEILAVESNSKVETDLNMEPPDHQPGEDAKSLLCNDCGRKFRSTAQAEFHASKTGHVDFAESTEEITPLTEGEKKVKLEELRKKLAEKRAGGSEQDKMDKKRNEEIRRKSTKETQDIKEDLKKREQLKEAAIKRKEKLDDIAAKERIKHKIAADKEERRLQSENEKAKREGRYASAGPVAATIPTSSGHVASKPASAYTETRLRLQLPSKNITQSFPVTTTLLEVASVVSQDSGFEPGSFTQIFPKKVFNAVDFGASLKELGLVPSASLIVK